MIHLKIYLHITAFGTAYNPSKASLKLPALNSQLTAAKKAVASVNSAEPAYKNAVSARDVAFASFSKLITRVSNALKASHTTTQVYERAMTLIRKLQDRRATQKMTVEEKKVAAEAGNEVREISSSQMGFDGRLDNFDKLIKLLTSVSAYAPNEADLKVTAPTTLLTDLRSAKFVASKHTKASTFAIHANAPHSPKIAKELAFFPSRKDTFQQLERL